MPANMLEIASTLGILVRPDAEMCWLILRSLCTLPALFSICHQRPPRLDIAIVSFLLFALVLTLLTHRDAWSAGKAWGNVPKTQQVPEGKH